MKKYLIYMRRMCALLLVLVLLVSQDIVPVHALPDDGSAESTAVETLTENGSGSSEDSDNNESSKNTVIETPTENGAGSSEDGGNKDGINKDESKDTTTVTPSENGSGDSEDGINKDDSKDTTTVTPSENENDKMQDPADGMLPDSDTLQEDKILSEEEDTPETYAGTSAYDENGIHVNPTTKEKTDPLGTSVTVAAGNNSSGEGTLNKPYYSLGKAYNEAKDNGKIYVHNGVIISGGESGTVEDGSTVLDSGEINTAVYFKDNKHLTVLQADKLDALFTVQGGSLTLQNMSMGIVDNDALADAQLRVALSGGKVILGENLTVPDDGFYFHVTETVGGTKEETDDKAPIEVKSLPKSDGEPIPVLVSSALVDKYMKYTKTPDDVTKTTTEEWTVNIPIAQIPEGVDLTNVVLKGIGSMETISYDVFTADPYEEKITDEKDQQITTEWNTPLKFELKEGNVVYLTGYHKKVIQAVNNTRYQGLIYVGLDSKGKEGVDTNDGLTIDTPVKTLTQAKKLLDQFDKLYSHEYKYPKIYINKSLYVREEQSLDFTGYEATPDAPSETGYRASLWYGDHFSYYDDGYTVIHVLNGSRLDLGKGVNIKDLDIVESAKNPEQLRNKKPEEVTGVKTKESSNFISCVGGCNISLNNMRYESDNGVLIDFYNTGGASVTIEDCNITAKKLFYECRYRGSGSLNLQILGTSAVDCTSDVLYFYNGSDSAYDLAEESVRIALNGDVHWNQDTNKPEGEGYLYSKSGAVISYRGSDDYQGKRKGEVRIESGLLAGNGTALMNLASCRNEMSLYMKDGSKYYQANGEGSIIAINYKDQSQIYYQGGEIQSQGKAFLNTMREDGTDYRLILDGGRPVTQGNKPLKILAEKQWVMPHIYLGDGKTDAYNKEKYASMIELDLYNADPEIAFSDMSKLVGKMNGSDNLETIRPMFRLLYDEAGEIYEGKAIMTSQGGTYLLLGVNGIYIDGTEYNKETGFGGRPYGTTGDDTYATGSMVNPVRTFWDAQRVYNAKSEDDRKKLNGIYILNEVTIVDGSQITVAGTDGAASTVKESADIPSTYTCNFGNLTIYDSTNSPASNVDRSVMLNVKNGSLTLDYAVLDGSLISKDDKASRQMIYVNQNCTLDISHTTIQNMNYSKSDDGAIYINGGKLKVDNSKVNDTNSRYAIYCKDGTECEIDSSEIISTGSDSYGATIYNGTQNSFILQNSFVISNHYKSGLYCETYATCKIIDSQVESAEGTAAIYVAGFVNHGSCSGGNMNISGEATKIKGKKAIYYVNSEDRYKIGTWSLNISGMAKLEATEGNALNFWCRNAQLRANISGATITASEGACIYYYSGITKPNKDQIILNPEPGKSVELNAKSAKSDVSDGVKVDGQSKSGSLIVGLGGNVKIKIESGEDFDFGNSNAVIALKKELTGNETYLVKTLEHYMGKTVVDCSEVESNANANQKHFTLCNESVELYKNLGITLIQSGDEYYPAVKNTNQQLWIPVSETIFWDYKNGNDHNADQENGGHCPELAVKTVNGIRSVLLKDGKLKIEGTELKVTDTCQTPVKVVAMSDMICYGSGSVKSSDSNSYGDDFSSGHYKGSNATNTANLLNWVMPKPTNGEYLIDIMKINYNDNIGYIFSLNSSDDITFQMENVKFSGLKESGKYGSQDQRRIRIGGKVRLVMNNCYVDCTNDSYVGDFAQTDDAQVIYIKNSKRDSEISNVTIEKNRYYGIRVIGDDNVGLLLNQVKITDGSCALSLSGSAAMGRILGENSLLKRCEVSNGGRLIAEEGTIIGYRSGYYTYEAVRVDKGEFYLKGTASVKCSGNDGVYVSSEGKAYLEGGEIIDDTSKYSSAGLKNYGTTELSGTTIKNCYRGAYLLGGNMTMTGGTITANTYGVYDDSEKSTMTLSGGSVSGNTYAGIYNLMTFIMNGGEICNNGTFERSDFTKYGLNCGGIARCKDVTITGGKISGNKGYICGGIVCCEGTVRISGGVIEENEGKTAGGGIHQEEGSVLVEGGRIRNNRAPKGSAVYVENLFDTSPQLELNGGEITGNVNTDKNMNTGEIYTDSSNDVKIGKKGSAYPKVEDTIYLNRKTGKIQLTAAVRGDYNIRVNERYFTKGDTVVCPDGSSVLSAASYLTHFTLLSDRYVLARKGTNLVLDGIVFVNGMADTDGIGALPNQPRNNFKALIEDASYNDNVIYVTGAIHIKSGETVTVTDRTIRRYTGQPINEIKYDECIYNEPLFIIDKGGTLNLINTTVSGRMGVKSDETYNKDTGYLIENYGTLNIDVNRDTIAAETSKDNHSVLADNLSSGLGIAQHGTMNMSVFSQVDQMIRLGGKGVDDTAVYYGTCAINHSAEKNQLCKDTEDRIINLYGDAEGSGLRKALNLDVDHKEDQRKVTTYTALNKSADLQTEKALHQIKDLKTSGYYLVSQISDENTGAAPELQQVDMILRKPGIYYVDGVKGDNSNKGICPDLAFETLEHAYEQLAADAANLDIRTSGGLIYIVKSVPLENLTIEQSGDASVMKVNGNSYNTQGAVTIRRYSKPTSTTQDGYDVASNQGTMFTIPADTTVSIQGVTIDGHSQSLDSEKDYLKAEGVTGADSIFEVSGTLNLGVKAAAQNTRIQNNDASGKEGGLIRVADGGILHITGDAPKAVNLDEGQTAVYGTVLTGGQAAKGSAVYAGYRAEGTVLLSKGAKSDYPQIDGDIYLTGNGTNSSFLSVTDGTAGAITDSRYALEVGDAYDGRLVVSYRSGTTLSATDVKGYTVSGRQGYDVAVSDDDKSQIILKMLGAVYIDGVNGKDTANGQTPATAVKTLNKAYSLLKTNKGGMLYVVNTVEIADTQKLTETSYTHYNTSIVLDKGTVQIQRYGKPSAYGDESQWTSSSSMEQFNVNSNENALFCVTGRGMLDLQTILIDGHSEAVTLTGSLAYKTNAGGVSASAPLIQVAVGGKLNLGEGAVLQNNKNETAPDAVDTAAGKLPGGAVHNTGTVTVTGGTVKGNTCTGLKKTYTISTGGTSETVNITGNASGIWQAGTLTFNVSDATSLNWDKDQYIYLDEQVYDAAVTDQNEKDAQVSFLNVQALPADAVLPLDLNRDGADGLKATGWFAPGRKVVEMNRAGSVTAENFTVNGDSYTGRWMDQENVVTEKLTLAVREETEKILELQRAARDCIIDAIVPVKASAETNSIYNLSEKAIKASGAADAEIPARMKNDNVTITGELGDTNRIKLSCSDGK